MSVSKSSILSAALLLGCGGLVACGSPAGYLGAEPTLSGQIQGWSRGSDFVLQGNVLAGTTLMAVATAPIDAMGNFSITLPGAATLTPYLTPQHVDTSQPIPGCSGSNVQISPQDFSTLALQLKAVSGTTKLSVTHGSKTPNVVNVGYIYSDVALTETGSVSCMFSTTTIQETIDIHFGVGWNREWSSTGTTITVSSGPLPDGVVWTAQ